MRPTPGGRAREASAEEGAGCEALAAQVLTWYRDPRVGAIFQFSFRDDPAFPVGLISPNLSHTFRVYGLWRALARARSAGSAPQDLARACA